MKLIQYAQIFGEGTMTAGRYDKYQDYAQILRSKLKLGMYILKK